MMDLHSWTLLSTEEDNILRLFLFLQEDFRKMLRKPKCAVSQRVVAKVSGSIRNTPESGHLLVTYTIANNIQ